MRERELALVRNARESLLASRRWLDTVLQLIGEREVSNRTNLQRAVWSVEHALDDVSKLLAPEPGESA